MSKDRKILGYTHSNRTSRTESWHSGYEGYIERWTTACETSSDVSLCLATYDACVSRGLSSVYMPRSFSYNAKDWVYPILSVCFIQKISTGEH